MTKSEKIFQVVARIPRGKVATYGQVALLSDSGPRAVGQVLHQNQDPKKFPCHRVVHADGGLADGYAFGGEGKQMKLLQNEGVSFEKSKINLLKYGWTPT